MGSPQSSDSASAMPAVAHRDVLASVLPAGLLAP